MILKIGHRGAAGYEPENTLLSFKRAIEMHVNMIEMDVQACSTGEIVVMHDLKVDRTTNGRGYVKDLTMDEISNLQIKKEQHIPTLYEALRFIDGKSGVNIEIKRKGISKDVSDLINEFVKNKTYDYEDFLVSSFDQYELADFKRINDKVRTGVLLSGFPINLSEGLLELDVYSANVNVEFIDEEMVNEVHSVGRKIYVWTVDDPDDIYRMKRMNVDGIISNYPDRI